MLVIILWENPFAQQCCQLLLEKDARVGAKDQLHRTALHRAAIGGHMFIARLLIDAGAEVDSIDSYGNTPMHLALEEGHIELAVVLAKDYQADPSIQNKEKKTPLDLVVNESLRRSLCQRLNL
jgi:ankyrin repeat protein